MQPAPVVQPAPDVQPAPGVQQAEPLQTLTSEGKKNSTRSKVKAVQRTLDKQPTSTAAPATSKPPAAGDANIQLPVEEMTLQPYDMDEVSPSDPCVIAPQELGAPASG